MASGLSIVIDTRNAELNIKNLNQALERLETQGNSVANMMRNLGGANPFAGLTTSITSLKDSFNDFAGSTNTAKTAIKNLADGFTSAKTAIDNATTASNAFNDSVKKVYTSADILTNKIGALNGGFTVLSQKADTASSALSRFAQNATTTGSSMGGLISQSHTLAQNMANMGAASNTGANNTGTALARVNGALSNTQAQMNGFNNTARNTQNTFNQFNANIHNTQNNFTQLNNNVNLTRNSLTALSSVVTNNTMVINNYSRSAVSAAQSTALFQRSAQGLESTLMRLQTLMTGGLFGMAALSIAKTADAMQGLENQVRLVTQGEEQREEVQRRLLVVANKNYSDIEAVTGSYQRNAFALAQLGKSQMDVLNFTDALSLAMRTGGRSMLEQKSAVYQLSQAMGAGKLMGDEFRALSENAPIILKYIAKEMGVAQGALKELGSEGKITSEIIYNAMMKARPEMEKMAQSLPITMSQAWQQVNNSYKTFVDNFMNGTGGMSQGIASMLQGIGKNFDTIVKSMTIAGGLAFIGFASKIDIATKSMALFNLVANANPFVRMATIILAVSSAFYGLDDVINTTSVIMGDLIHMVTDGWTGIFNLIGDGLNSLQGAVAQNNDDIGKSYKDMFTNATTDHDKFIANATFASNNLVKTISTDNMKNEQSYFGFYSRTQKGFLGFVEFVGTAVIAAVSTLGGFFKFIFNAIEDTLKHMGNALMTAEEWIQKKLGNNVQHKRYDTFNNLSAPQSYADVNSAGQKAWHGIIMGWADKLNSKQPTVNGMPASMDYKPPVQTPSSDSDTKDKKKKAHDLLKGEIADAIQWAAADLKIRPNDLAAVISFETSGTFSPAAKNPTSSATGLIQFMADKYKSYGYTRNEFAALGANEQMKYVVQYLKGRGIGQGSGLGDIYDAVAGYGYRRGSKAYELNRKWDANRDGYVAKGEAVTARAFQPHIKNYFPNGINLQDVGKVETDLAKNQAALDKAREDYIASIATGEAKINAQLNKAIADLPSKGFSGQALEDEKKRLTEEAELDRLLSRETNRQKLDELMAVHKTRKDQILDESYLQGLTIAADESKSREQRKAELEALDVGTKEKIRLNDIANKYELGKIWAFRKTSSELIADEWDEKIQAAMNGNDELKDEYIASYKEQKQLALDIDKLNYQQQLLDLQKFNMADIAYLEQTLKVKKELIAKSNATPEMQSAQNAAADYQNRKDVFSIFKNQPENLDRPLYFGKGAEGQYQEAMYNAAEILRIYDKNYADLEARGELHSQTMIDFQRAYDEAMRQSNESILEAKRNVMSERLSIWSQGLDMAGDVWGQMTDIVTNSYGKQSAAARAFFFVQKTIAAAQAVVNTEEAATKALAQGGALFGIPMATLVRATGYASAGIILGQGIAGAMGKGFSTGGYTGNMGVNDVAGVVHGKEYVLNAAATKRIGVDNLNAMNRGSGVGNNNVSVNVVVNADGSSDVQANAQIGKQMGDAIKAAVLQTIVQEKRQGGLLSR